jgi:hypothetical protein
VTSTSLGEAQTDASVGTGAGVGPAGAGGGEMKASTRVGSRSASLLVCVVIGVGPGGPAAFGGPGESPSTSPSARFDLKTMMTPKEARASGLEKLSPDELVALNAWLERLMITMFSERKAKGCNPPIEGAINGTFKGWSGDTIFQLQNGQIWKQESYDYTYEYAYSPKVLIYQSGATCKMTVEGVRGTISVGRLK